MTAGKYSAGTIFLQVVPVFRNLQNQIRDEVKDLNDALGNDMEKVGRESGRRAGKAMGEEMAAEAEKSGDKAGKAYAGKFASEMRNLVKTADKELSRLDPKMFDTVSDDLERIKAQMKALSNVDFTADFDANKVLGQIAVVNASLKKLAAQDYEINLSADMATAMKSLGAIEKKAEQVAKERRDLRFEMGLETRKAERQMGSFEKKFRSAMKSAADSLGDNISDEIREMKARLNDLATEDLEIGLDTQSALAEAKVLRDELQRLNSTAVDIDAEIDTAAAYGQLAAFEGAISVIDGRQIDIQVDVDTGNAVARLGLLNTLLAAFRPRAALGAAGAEATANSFRTFNFAIFGAVTLLPALIPLIGATGGALIALLPILGALGAGMGVAILGFSGIGDAVSEMGKVADEASLAGDKAADAGKSMAAASHAVADAERALADARRSAARANQDAARAVADAREAAADAIEQAYEQEQQAAEEYRDAVQDVKDAEQDLADARKRAREEMEEAKDKTRKLAVEERQGVLDLLAAQANFNAVQADGSATNTEKEQASIDLEQAQIALNEIREAQATNAEEVANGVKNGVSGNEAVQSAQEALTEAIEAQAEAQEAVAEAAENTRDVQIDAAEQVADALRNQRRTQADGARAVADAVRNLQRAHESQGAAAVEAAQAQTAAQDRLQVAMDKLGPAGQKFAKFIYGLKAGFYDLRDGVQAAMLPGVQSGLQTIIDTYGPQFKAFSVDMASTLGDMFDSAGKGLSNPLWQRFFGTYGKLLPELLGEFGQTTGNWMSVYASALTLAAPLAEAFSDALLRLSEDALSWMESPKGIDKMTAFFDYVERIGPKVEAFFVAVAGALINLGVALAPYGETILGILTSIFDFISGMDPAVLGTIATAIIGLVIAFQAAAFAGTLYAAGQVAFATTAGIVLFGVIALAVGLYLLYQNSETARAVMDKVAAILKDLGGFALNFADNNRTLLATVAALIGTWYAYRKIMLLVTLAQKAYKAQLITTKIALVALFVKEKLAAAYRVGKLVASFVASTAVMIAQKIQLVALALWQGIVAVATGVWTAAQWLLNAAMSMNPIGLVIIAIVAFVALLVLAYKKSDTFRGIVDKVWGMLKKLWGVLMDNKKMLLLLLGPIGLVILAFVKYRDTIKDLWNKYARPIFGWMKSKWDQTVGGMKKAWTNHLKPVFDTFTETVIPALETAFSKMVEGIGVLWSGLKKLLGEPVKFVIEKVINGGLIAGFNSIGKLIGKGDQWIKPLSVPDWAYDGAKGERHARGGIIGRESDAYKTGGTLPGYTPGRDPHKFYSATAGNLELSGGEAIMRPEFTRAVGSNWVDQMNAAARSGGVKGVRQVLFGPQGQRFASGGIVFPVPRFGGRAPTVNRSEYNLNHDGMDINHPLDGGPTGQGGVVPFLSATTGTVSRSSMGDYGYAVGVNSPYGNLIYGHAYPGSHKVKVGQSVTPGQVLGLIGNTGNSEGAHLHFGFPGGTFAQAANLLSGSPVLANGKAASKYPAGVKAFLANPVGWIKNKINAPISNLRDQFKGNAFANAVFDMPGLAVKASASWLKDKIPALGAFSAAGNFLGIGNGDDGPDGVRGPNQAPPTRSDATIAAANGGILPYNGQMMYDNGGYLPPGLTSVVNLTGKPERVFTDDQFDKMGSNDGADSFTYAPTFNASDLTAADVVEDLDFTRRKMAREGKYSRNR